MAELLMSSREAFIPYAPIAHPPATVHDWVEQVLIPSGGVSVACQDGTILGVLAVSHDDGAGWIDQLYVAPACAGRGIGSALLQLALSSLTRPIRLRTFQANSGARRFYERHGFRALSCTDGSANEERCPDVLYELSTQ
ncbi:GNAT family N-acetyltransferase [Chitinolyticbacter meiyuanensis]|uniref:GNAT family N-acetyltransferase n=1 Tax=Chitinolyticbacter meiyuanensis TaxID=682798 RepID=UPI0016521A6B|nr:GNAT family N-acetyltransferase [Chitinolyticbacter meiyuanensis]